ncbi:coiled-coil domain-containing protein 170 isoform X4 [Marmota marmota marmota]|uniref:coiled-coil domain-containing protein 170 isoform X4 n=1 Tax=Marmota marmota marmota TaxID=9994 RepID=UPI00209268C1|nr:coiled-coil domain-containing protein 170 isoform X4 [Marmota marmota marmota]
MSRRGSSGSRSLDASSHAASPAPEETRDHSLEVPVSREQLNHYRNVVENVRSELAATLVKFESAQSELRDLRSKMLSKEVSCQELKAEMENYKENNARKSSLLTSLRDRVQELEEESAALSASKIRTELTAHAAIKENQELMKRVVELEEKLQKCSKENEENKKQVSKHSRKHEEFLIQLHDSLDPDKRSEKASEEDLILKLRELCKEITFVKGQIVTLEESLNVHEMEAKANRETIVRLASEVNREQRKTASWKEEKDQLNQMVSQLEAQRAELVEQLGKVSESHQEALQRAHKAEDKLETLQGQLTHLEGELVSSDVLRDNLNFEKQKYLKFLDQLSEKMRLDRMAAELGFDMRLDVVLARAEQLVRLESSAVVENKTIAYNLQRKLKTQKERLESRELHMNLLRQKIAQLEEEKQVRSALATERDEAQLTIRKLEMKVGRMQKELNVCRESNLELKAKLADTSELKIKTLEQTKTIEHLNKSRDQLEKMKEKVEKQLSSVRAELDTAGREAEEGKERARHMLEAVTSEMKTLKRSLEDAEKREKQLADFREVVSQMLGLNMTALALPDYEIIKCLERLIHLHQHRLVSCACLKDMTSGQDRHPQGHLKLLH